MSGRSTTTERTASAAGSAATWSSGPCRALAHDFDVTVPADAGFEGLLSPVVGPFRHDGTGPRAHYVVRREPEAEDRWVLRHDGARLCAGLHPQDLVGTLTWHINRSVIEKSIGSHVLLHAAAVVRDDVTVILPADQERGKTTTCAGLLRAGFDYVTDEAVAIDPVTTQVAPFPKCLSLDPGSWGLFPEAAPADLSPRVRQWQVPAERLGSRPRHEPVAAPGVVLFPRYVEGSTTTLTRVSRGEAVRELALMSFDFPAHAARNLRVLAAVAGGARVLARLTIGSLDDAVSTVSSLIDTVSLEDQ